MTALEVFRYMGADVRTVTVDGEPWFVLADLTRVLGLSQFRTDRLDDSVIRNHVIEDSTGRSRMSNIVSEAGMYEVVIRSDKPGAVEFRRWITSEVLPSIRRTGAYAVPQTREQLLAAAVIEANAVIAEAHEQIADLSPRAEAWDELASAEGDFSVADAAKMLARAGVVTGPKRLFDYLAEIGWTFRAADGRPRAYAQRVDAGHLAERPQSHHHPRTGAVVIDPPQIRVTIAGLNLLRKRMQTNLRAVSA